MQIFQKTQKYFALFGISANQKNLLNRRSLLAFFTQGLAFFSFGTYLLQPSSSTEYISSIYFTSATVVSIFFFAVLLLRMERLFKFINDCENTINKSKQQRSILFKRIHFKRIHWQIIIKIQNVLESKNPTSNKMYTGTLRQADIFSRFVFLTANVSLQLLMWPKFIASIFLYFTTNSGYNSLGLPFPMGWVKNLMSL